MTLPRPALISDFLVLTSNLRCCDPNVGFVGLRGFGMCSASSIISTKRPKASALFISWLRALCALITTTPSLEILLSGNAKSLVFTSAGNCDANALNLSWTAEDTLLTFCPPGP